MAADVAAYVQAARARAERERSRARERAAELRGLGLRLAALCRAFGAGRVVLFGSVARGLAGPAADLDLAVTEVPPARFFDLHGRLLLASPVPVDLVDLGDCSDSLRARIAEEGVEL